MKKRDLKEAKEVEPQTEPNTQEPQTEQNAQEPQTEVHALGDDILTLINNFSENVDEAVNAKEDEVKNARLNAAKIKDSMQDARIALLRMECEAAKKEANYYATLLEIAYAEDAQHQYKAQRAGYRQAVLQMWKLQNGIQDRTVQFGENNTVIVK